MDKANIKFIESAMKFKVEERDIYEVEIPQKLIKSGDYFVCLRLDGVDPLIMYATGGRGAHSVQALWFGEDLYIVESQ